jgi:hypothetical protein
LLGGPTLDKLNIIRTTHYVFIDWDSQKKCLRVNSERSENDVTAAIKAVRQAVKNAEAEAAFSNPLYIIVPPNADAMRMIVGPASIVEDAGRKSLIGMKLAGDELSKEEKRVWEAQYDKLLLKNRTDFEKRLSEIAIKLAHFMPWMRMRVHFGHVCLKPGQFQAKFANSEYNFDAFVKMMKSPRMTGGSLDRR